jgi:opacity protein-like surface antigen
MNLSTFIRIVVYAFLLILPAGIFAQVDDEDYYESLLKTEVENLNVVYKPVIGFGYGYMNFFGEVKNRKQNPLMGNPAYKVNVSTFIDSGRYLRANFYLMLGQLGGNKFSATDPAKNLNFLTDITTFGINLHYDFKHFIKPGALITPFVSVGIENVQFNSKTDLYYGENIPYIYQTDGTIRDGSGRIIKRDNIYETDLRDLDLYGLGSYNQSTFAIPVDAGLDFAVSNRVTMRLGYSLHYTFTDNIDNISSKAKTGVKGDKMNDMFGYSYMTFHFDLFTSPKTITINKLFADYEGVDYTLFEDSDLDLINDMNDKCPNTPASVEVDTVGCPFDDDKDGVPNYIDKELHSRVNAMVDNNGVEIDAEKLAEELSSQQSISRSDVESFLMMQRARARYNMGKSSIPIPQRYKRLDKNKDDYISFDELLDAIDEFFDDSPDLKTTKDIYELNDFFFAQ